MKIFERDGKTNFVDDNNVLVGFDSYQSCCEDFGWFVSNKIPNETKPSIKWNPEKWDFVPDFYKKIPIGNENLDDYNQLAVFQITNGKTKRYLVLYNHHNGYYSHGFNMNIDGKTIFEGEL